MAICVECREWMPTRGLTCGEKCTAALHARNEGAAVAFGIIALGEWARRCGRPLRAWEEVCEFCKGYPTTPAFCTCDEE